MMYLMIAIFVYYIVFTGLWNVSRKDNDSLLGMLADYLLGWIAFPIILLGKVFK